MPESAFDKLVGPIAPSQRALAQAIGWRLPGSVTKAAGVLPIPLTAGYVNIVTGGVEALTLADGEPGQIITLRMQTDGGTGTLTPARKTGFTTIAFADVGNHITLKYADDTLGWIVLGAAGFAAGAPVLA